MRTVLDLTWRLLRGGGRRGALGTALTFAAVAVFTGLLLFAVGGNHAFDRRADADAWRHPAEAADPARATAVQALSTDHVRGRPITIVELAPLNGRDAPVPPGMPRAPRPGEVWVSPELGALMRELPRDQLADRFVPAGRAAAGTLGRDALQHPAELVAVIGRTAADPALREPRAHSRVETVASPVPITGYQSGAVSTRAQVYRTLMIVASVLMVVPLLVFGGAAARLTVARRDERLAALRLVGATPGQVVAVTTAEAVATAAAGALAGTLLYAAAVPALTRIAIAGGGWYAADLWPSPAAIAGVLAAVPLLVGASAVAGLRRVVISPLGVARRHTPPALRAVRPLALMAVVVAFGVAGSRLAGMGRAGVVVLLVFLALAFLAINLAGPWVVALIGRIVAATARRPAGMLAGRRLADDPRAAWRTVAGVALAGFVAGFLALLTPDVAASGPSDRLDLVVPRERSAAVAAEVRGRVDGLPARVAVAPHGVSAAGRPVEGGDRDVVSVTVTGGGAAALDRVRTALAGTVPGRVATTPAEEGPDPRLVGDLRTGALVVLAVSFLIAVTSAGITSASAVLDRRRAYAALGLAGTPLSVLDRARRQETLIPLAVMGGGSVGAGLFFALPFARGVGGAGALTVAAFAVVGSAAVLGASALSRPLLRSVTTDPSPHPD